MLEEADNRCSMTSFWARFLLLLAPSLWLTSPTNSDFLNGCDVEFIAVPDQPVVLDWFHRLPEDYGR
jgi:hypothetical protein